MPIGGFVINIDPADPAPVIEEIRVMEGVEVHGHDEKGNVVAVLDCRTSEEMEELVGNINQVDGVLSVGLTYFNAEDEVERMEKGEYIPSRSFGNKPLRQD
jgi:nitrate reductase NapD